MATTTIQEILQKSKEEKFSPITISHHILMSKYGWIPWEEFKQLPISTAENLLQIIKFEAEEQERKLFKAKSKRR